MPSDVVKTVVEAGLVEDSTLKELGRWGTPRMEKEGPEMPAEVVPLVLERAMQEESFVEVRETDLEVLSQYLRTQQKGHLKVEFLDGRKEEFDLDFGVTPLREIIFACTDNDIVVALQEGLTSLVVEDKELKLSNPRVLHYGKQQAFIVCRAG